MQTLISNSHGSHSSKSDVVDVLDCGRCFVVAWTKLGSNWVILQRKVSGVKTPQEAVIQVLKAEVSSELFLVKDFYYLDEVIATAYDLGFSMSVINV
jgi:hypothetical protein